MGGLNIRKTNYGYSLLHSLHHSDKAFYQYSFNVNDHGDVIVSLDYEFNSLREMLPFRFLERILTVGSIESHLHHKSNSRKSKTAQSRAILNKTIPHCVLKLDKKKTAGCWC